MRWVEVHLTWSSLKRVHAKLAIVRLPQMHSQMRIMVIMKIGIFYIIGHFLVWRQILDIDVRSLILVKSDNFFHHDMMPLWIIGLRYISIRIRLQDSLWVYLQRRLRVGQQRLLQGWLLLSVDSLHWSFQNFISTFYQVSFSYLIEGYLDFRLRIRNVLVHGNVLVLGNVLVSHCQCLDFWWRLWNVLVR